MNDLCERPNALADQLVFGFTATLNGAGRLSLRRLLGKLSKIGRITTPNSKRADEYAQVTLHLLTDDDRCAGEVRVDLHLHVTGENITFGNRCSIQCNGMTMLRGVLDIDPSGTDSFDGKANYIGGQYHASDVVEQQLAALGEAAQYVLDALAAAFGENWRPDKLWIKSAEASRDYLTNDAIADVRVVQHAAICGTIERRWDEYQRLASDERDGIPSLRFISQVNGAELKLYPKSPTVRRIEFRFPNSQSINRLVGVQREDFSAKGLQRLSLHFLTTSVSGLDRLERHVDQALEAEASITNLLVAMQPMIDRAAGKIRAKGPASDSAQLTAKRLLDALLSVGMCNVTGTHARHAIRRDLDALCTNDGPLVRHPKRAIYYLKPAFARACSAIRLSPPTNTTVQL